jgi:Tfp pilus assembly protein PilV
MIELLLVTFIVGIGLLGLTALMSWNLRAQGSGRQKDTAAYLANDVLERLSADGRLTSALRANAQVIPPATYLLAEAADNTQNIYQAPDSGNVLRATFDLEGRPTAATPIFSVNWVRRAPKSVVPVASSASATAEVVVNVTWSEPGATAVPIQKWLSCSRLIRY